VTRKSHDKLINDDTMLEDLDTLMRHRGISVAIVPMHEAMHPSFRWISRGAKVTRGYAIKPLDRPPLLITYPMERDEAAATGLEVRLAGEYGYDSIFESAPDHAAAYSAFFAKVLRSIGCDGPVAFFGNAPIHLYPGVVEAMERDGWKIHRSNGEDLIQVARKRKDEHEVEAIRSVGQRTEEVVDAVRAVLREARVSGSEVLHHDKPLTLGFLKDLVSREIVRLGMVEDHETILSQGRDAAVPHSRGDAAARVRPSVPIILDIFPADRSNGYFFDLSRTFCVGEIPGPLQTIHAHVFEAFNRARTAVRPNTLASSYQSLVCDYFEELGYATNRSHPGTLSGYVHGLGHGVGLDVHERPSFHLSPSNRDLIEAGDIITIEPGLYFPDLEIGVRIEDTFVVREEGADTLCRGDYGLVP
jgi:Xaa-Pro aminopeptidase